MRILNAIGRTALAVWLIALCGTVTAQTNPLYEHRRAFGAAPVVQSVITGTVLSATGDGRVKVDTPSERLIVNGIKSGDPVEIDLGMRSIRAYVEFSDERARAKNYYTQTQKPGPLESGVTLVVDRLHTAEPIVLDSSAGGAVMHLGVDTGQRIIIRFSQAGGAR